MNPANKKVVAHSASGLPLRLRSLTSLRFFAAAAVLIHHTLPNWPHYRITVNIFNLGYLGVSFFFILSGFVLTYSRLGLNQKRDSNFLLRRISRIYPLHAIFLTFSILGFLATKASWGGYTGTSKLGTLLNYLLIHGWIPLHPNIRQGWNGVSWTLSLEFFFYICFNVLFKNLYRCNPKNLMSVSLILYSIYTVSTIYSGINHLTNFQDVLYYFPVPRIFEFIYGMIMAILIYSKPKVLFVRPTVSWLVLIISIVTGAELIGLKHGFPAEFNLIAIPGFCLLIWSYALTDIRGKKSVLHAKLFYELGEESYALYISHVVLLAGFGWGLWALKINGSNPLGGEVLTFTFIFACLGVARFLHTFVELPTQKLLLRFFSRS